MALKPLHDWALIRPSSSDERTKGGIIIPDTAKGQPQEGVILAIGEGRYTEPDGPGAHKGKRSTQEKVFVKTTLKPGDRVIYEKYAGRKIEMDGEELILVREDDVLGQMVG
ncbi:MAG TPA: co-chaperone GroES [Nitrospiria bacterium]|nr:co-chaperone GroES [Nitrospiria bacterium]